MISQKPDSAYKVRGGNLPVQYKQHREEYLKTVDRVFLRGDLILRRDLGEFEKKIAKFVGVKYAVGVNSGTSALDVAFRAADIGLRDEVITVAHTFIASISCVYLAGAKPVLIDVGEDFNMDVKQIEKALTKKTKAIEPVHLNGRLCDMEVILDVAKRKGLIVIEDAAQAMGATLKMNNGKVKKAGSFGLIGCFSLYPFKILGAFGNSGVATTDDPEMERRMRLLRYNGEDRKTRKFFYHGHNFLMDNLQAALLNVKLAYLPRLLKRRKEIAKLYHKGLADVKQIRLPNFADKRFSDVYQNYVIRAQKRDELWSYLDKKGVQTPSFWTTPMYKQPAMQPNDIFLPETEKICKEVISLPLYPELTNIQIQYVIKILCDFYRG